MYTYAWNDSLKKKGFYWDGTMGRLLEIEEQVY